MGPLTVYYDEACPRCVRDRARYEKLAGARAAGVVWVDVNASAEALRRKGIEPAQALRTLHVEDAEGNIHRELDAYSLLMRPVPALRPLAFFLRLPVVRGWISALYRRSVLRRLQRQGRS